MIDIGVNLTNKRFDKDLNDVITNAKLVGISNMIITGTSVIESQKALELTQIDTNFLHSTAGVHPHDASTFNSQSLIELKEIALNTGVKAIGECGLDFNRNYSTKAEQEYAFIAQLELAIELNLPVFMHERDANIRFCQILKPYRDRLSNAVLHCFTGDSEDLKRALDLDLHIGITGWICDERRGQHLLELVKVIPRDRLMIETDSPYLLPRSMRPKPKSSRNEPKYLPYIAKVIADARDEDLGSFLLHCDKTTKDFFKLR